MLLTTGTGSLRSGVSGERAGGLFPVSDCCGSAFCPRTGASRPVATTPATGASTTPMVAHASAYL